ncbi:flagellar filament capping protein FliD [Magnetospirillum sp. ME-1]|uniref:flagellar filament capping protein FliD n=1 Tax=Magnetospirillum sp. ME-1 TaxID=1639348 RepID=UPI000A192951|nr:flagellar filament capping protein FliD [Magnetospirillum sp. ME-1]
MSTNAVSALPTALAGLLKQYANPTQKGEGTATSPSTANALASPLSLGRDEAYSLSLGSAQSGQAMMGYTRLATLGAQVGGELQSVAAHAADSGGAGSVQVEVKQLAQAQTLVTSLFGDPDSVSLGTGTLQVLLGELDSETGAFNATGEPVEIAITGGSLNDIAKSINAAAIGLSAQVVESGGGFELEISGKDTGAAKAFSLSGLGELEFDPSRPNLSPLTITSEAQDAFYTIDGTDFTWPSNTDVPVAFGTTAAFTQTGTQSVPKSSLTDTIRTMMKSFNGLQQAIVEMTGDKGELAANANLAAGMFKRIGDAAMAGYSTGGEVSTLADIGISVEKNGTLSIDQSILAQALGKDPAAVQSLVAQAAKGMDDAIRPYLGNKGAISSQVTVLGSLLGRGSSLLDYLGGGAKAGGGLAGNAGSLLSALG